MPFIPNGTFPKIFAKKSKLRLPCYKTLITFTAQIIVRMRKFNGGGKNMAKAACFLIGAACFLIGAPINYAGAPINFAGAPINFVGAPINFVGAPINFVGAAINFAGAPTIFAGAPTVFHARSSFPLRADYF